MLFIYSIINFKLATWQPIPLVILRSWERGDFITKAPRLKHLTSQSDNNLQSKKGKGKASIKRKRSESPSFWDSDSFVGSEDDVPQRKHARITHCKYLSLLKRLNTYLSL